MTECTCTGTRATSFFALDAFTFVLGLVIVVLLQTQPDARSADSDSGCAHTLFSLTAPSLPGLRCGGARQPSASHGARWCVELYICAYFKPS